MKSVTKVDNTSIKNSSECGNLLPTSPNLQINVHIKLHVHVVMCISLNTEVDNCVN